MDTRTARIAGLAAVVAGTAALAYVLLQQRRGPTVGPDGVVDAVPTEGRAGTPADRGRTAAYALDVERVRGRDDLEPVVQYLTFIQSQRGDDSHLLFVRYEDIDAMAALEGDTVPTFLERLDQLGVVVSNN